MSAADPVIRIRGLRNQFGDQVVHENLDLDVQRGEIIGVVGGSGSGKSVLLRPIIGLGHPAAGSIRLFGEEVTTMSEARRTLVERRCGVLFQNGALVSYWIAYEFNNPILQAAISANKDKLAGRIMTAFEREAKRRLGQSTS